MLDHVGQHPHPCLEAVLHHDHVDEAEIAGRARAHGAPDESMSSFICLADRVAVP